MTPAGTDPMKLLLEILLSLILHPVAFILALVNIAGRNDLNTTQKVIWAVVSVFWGVGPILYVLVGGGALW
jgi:type IV secretory pathway VirB2 component (pilin)